LFNYDANDRFTAGDTYDNDGNTVSSGGVANVYDFENHLIQQGGEQDRVASQVQTTSYNVYDGHGSVRALTNTTGAVTDTYDYDAFGNLIHDGLNAEQLPLRRRTVRPRPPPLLQPRQIPEREHRQVLDDGYF